MSNQAPDEKDLGAQKTTVSAGDKPADTRIAPGVSEQIETENPIEKADTPAQPKKRRNAARIAGVAAACVIALVAVFAGVGYATGFIGAAQSAEQTQQQSGHVTSSDAQRSASGQSGSSRGDGEASSSDSSNAKDENSSADSNADKKDGSSSADQATQSAPSSSFADSAAGSTSSTGSDEYPSSSEAPSSSSAPAYEEPAPAPAPAPSTISVYISIDSSRAQSYGLGGFSYGATVELPQGATVYDALCATGVSISGSSYYVSAINGLAEKQCGNGSGWTYAVNGSFPGKACGRYTLSGGESISWIYSTEKDPTIAM